MSCDNQQQLNEETMPLTFMISSPSITEDQDSGQEFNQEHRQQPESNVFYWFGAVKDMGLVLQSSGTRFQKVLPTIFWYLIQLAINIMIPQTYLPASLMETLSPHLSSSFLSVKLTTKISHPYGQPNTRKFSIRKRLKRVVQFSLNETMNQQSMRTHRPIRNY